MKKNQISRFELAGYLISPSLFVMITLMVVEAMLAAADGLARDQCRTQGRGG